MSACAQQRCTDTGALTQERMKNFDGGEVIPKAEDFMARWFSAESQAVLQALVAKLKSKG